MSCVFTTIAAGVLFVMPILHLIIDGRHRKIFRRAIMDGDIETLEKKFSRISKKKALDYLSNGDFGLLTDNPLALSLLKGDLKSAKWLSHKVPEVLHQAEIWTKPLYANNLKIANFYKEIIPNEVKAEHAKYFILHGELLQLKKLRDLAHFEDWAKADLRHYAKKYSREEAFNILRSY